MRVLLLLICILVPNATMTSTTPQSPPPTQSPQVQSLTKERTDLQNDLTRLKSKQAGWNSLYMWLAMGAVLLGAISWFSQRKVLNIDDLMNPKQDRIVAIDEEIRAIEKRESDATIAQSRVEAGDANKKAGDAEERAGVLEKEAATERARASQIEHDTAELKKQNLVTESQLNVANLTIERERARRIELEFSLAPRELWDIQFVDGTSSLDALKPLAGINIIVESVSDFEARRAAGSLVKALQIAHLKVVKTDILPDPAPGNVWDGVNVQMYLGAVSTVDRDFRDPTVQEQRDAESESNRMADIVTEFLVNNGWTAQIGWSERGELPEHTIRIRVGLKPTNLVSTNPAEWQYEEKKIQEAMQKMVEYRNRFVESGKRGNMQSLMRGPFPLPK
jgi:hypothetical protein